VWHGAMRGQYMLPSPPHPPIRCAALTDTFVWGKKIEKEVAAGVRTRVPTRAELRAEREAQMDEIERARVRRAQREAEREEMERLRAEEARLREAEQYGDWAKKEEEFHTNQAKRRVLIRIREGRGKPSDFLALNLLLVEMADAPRDLFEGDDAALAWEVELVEPYRILAHLPQSDLDDCLQDITNMAEYDVADPQWQPYWYACEAVARDEIRRLRVRQQGLDAGASMASLRVVEQEIDDRFAGKTDSALAAMDADIQRTIDGASASGGGGGGVAVDVEYWETIRRHLRVAQAKVALRRMHHDLVARRLAQLVS